MKGVEIVPRGRRTRLLPLGPGLAHARADGGPVLRSEVGWRTVAGIYLNTPWGCVWVMTR